MYTYKYPRPALTTDALIFGYDEEINELKLLLIQRLNEPFKDKWALPGGFVDMDESVEECVVRELEEETGLTGFKFEQLYTASKLGRDPRGRTVSVIFWSIAKINYAAKGHDDAKQASWFSVNNLPELAFDHSEIVELAINELKFRLKISEHFPVFFVDEVIAQNINEIKKIIK